MGLDYIRRESGKPWKKRWNGSLDRLRMPTLLDLAIDEGARVVTAEMRPGFRAKLGDTYVVECSDSAFVVSDGLRSIGLVPNPTPEAAAAVAAYSGYAEGVVLRVGVFGDTVELQLK